jgi:site-specific DNA-methyltransferase (adenine-specific)
MLDFGFYNKDCVKGMKEFPDKYFELAIVDPPYGGVTLGGYASNKVSGGVARNRNDYILDLWAQSAPSNEYFDELFRVSQNQIIWGGNYFIEQIARNSQCWIVWDKEKPEGVTYADVELAWTSFDRGAKIFRFAWNGMIQGDMKNKERKIHPTQKPVKLYKWLLRNFAHSGDKILDTHVGSASSLVACREMGFDYVGFELSENYYRLSRERVEAAERQVNIMDLMNDWRLP